MGIAGTNQTRWRRIIACALAYALALQGFLFALNLGSSAAAAQQDAAAGHFQLCSHDGGGASAPGAPSQAPAGSTHCLFCICGSTVYVSSAPPATPQYQSAVVASAMAYAAAPRLAGSLTNKNAWPRGPPVSA